jgi:hypothetical protein
MIVVIVVVVLHLQVLLFLNEVINKERKYLYLSKKENLQGQALPPNKIHVNDQEENIFQVKEEIDS